MDFVDPKQSDADHRGEHSESCTRNLTPALRNAWRKFGALEPLPLEEGLGVLVDGITLGVCQCFLSSTHSILFHFAF